MTTAIAKILAATLIVIALLGGMILLVVYRAPAEAIAGVSTAFGIAVAAVVPMVTRKDTSGKSGGAIVMLAAAAAFGGAHLGCGVASTRLPTPTVEQKQTAADAKYAEQLLACVRDHKGGGEPAIDDCAADVRARWGVDGGAR